MKRKIMPFIAAALLFASNVFAADVVVNNEKIDADAIVIDGRTMVPVRGIFEKLGFDVEWDNDEKTATLSNDSFEIKIKNGESSFTANGEQITPDVAQQIKDGRFYLPLRAISEAIGAQVEWNSDEKTAIVNYAHAQKAEETEEAQETEQQTEAEQQTEETTEAEAPNSESVSFKANVEKNASPSYIYVNDDGTYTIAAAGDKLYLQQRDADFNEVSTNSFTLRGSKLAAYYTDGENHFVFSADDKPKNGNTDVYVVDKYNADFTKKGDSIKINSENTTIERTLLGGSFEMKQNGDILSLVDAVDTERGNEKGNHTYLLLNYDMKHHTLSASNFFGRRKDDVYSESTLSKPRVDYGHENYVSLCWQYGDGLRVLGTEYTNVDETNTVTMFKTLNGKESAKNNITLEDFNVSDSNYIVVGTSVTQDGSFETNTDRNIVISTIGKTQLNESLVRGKFVTDYTADDNVSFDMVYLVEQDGDNFTLLWQETKGGKTVVKYAPVDGNGNVGEVSEKSDVKLSNCRPVYKDGVITWFVIDKDGSAPKLYKITL